MAIMIAIGKYIGCADNTTEMVVVVFLTILCFVQDALEVYKGMKATL